MRDFPRIFECMTSRERIVAMSLATGGVVAIVNSTVWAVAVAFMSYQRARVRLAESRAYAHGHIPASPFAQPVDDDDTPDDG